MIKSRVAAGVPQLTGREHDLAVAEWAEVICLIPREQLASVIRYTKANREQKATGFPIMPDEVLHAYKVMCAPKFLSTADAWNLAYTLAKAAWAAVEACVTAERGDDLFTIGYVISAEKPFPPELLEHPLLVKVLTMYGWNNFCYGTSKYQKQFVFDYKAEVEHALAEWADEFARSL